MTLAFGSRSTEVTLGYVLAFVVESDRDAVAGRKRHVISEFERGSQARDSVPAPSTVAALPVAARLSAAPHREIRIS
jgi:hypothetical protein